MYTYRSADRSRSWKSSSGKRTLRGRPAPKKLPSNQVVLLAPRAACSLAGAAEFEADLPAADDVEHTVVIVRLRGREEVETPSCVSSPAMLPACNPATVNWSGGVSQPVYQQLDKTGILAQPGRENISIYFHYRQSGHEGLSGCPLCGSGRQRNQRKQAVRNRWQLET